MSDKDETILEFLDSIDISLPPSVLHWNLMQKQGDEWSINTTRRRLSKLEEKGYVEITKEDMGYRGITEAGREFLRGEDDASKR